MKTLRRSRLLSDEELRRELAKPLPLEAVNQLRKIREADRWLLALNLQNMKNRESN